MFDLETRGIEPVGPGDWQIRLAIPSGGKYHFSRPYALRPKQ